jgi:glycolate oxidase iron-sulfur subunit
MRRERSEASVPEQKTTTGVLGREAADRCMKCGFCMSVCPVYGIDHRESHVARGRNMLIRMARDGALATDRSYQDSLSACLLCGRCEAMCPAGVPSPAIAIGARRELVQERGLKSSQRLIYRGMIKHRSAFAKLMRAVSWLPGLSHRGGAPARHFPDVVASFLGGMSIPRLQVPFLSRRWQQQIPARSAEPIGKVAVFTGCLFEFFMADAGSDMLQSLAELGFEVGYPHDQTCCGLPVVSGGDLDTARAIARRNIEVFSPYEHIVTGCASCGGHLKHYDSLFEEGDPFREKAAAFSRRVEDYSELLVNRGLLGPGRRKAGSGAGNPGEEAGGKRRVTYHEACHIKWKQRIGDAPRNVLLGIDNVEFVEMEGADSCCGLGGYFGVAHPDLRLAILAKKVDAIRRSGADIVTTSCPGCLLQLMDGLRRENLPIRAIHLAQLVQGGR